METEELFNAVYRRELNSTIVNNPSILEIKVPNNNLEWTSLHLAASLDFEEIIQLLLDSSVDKNCRDRYGWNAPHLAILNGHGIIKNFTIGRYQPECLTGSA